MSKLDKEMGMPKPADIKRIDPSENIKKNHKKKKYPPHWQIRNDQRLWPSKRLKGSEQWQREPVPGPIYIYCYRVSEEVIKADAYVKIGLLDEALAIYAKHHPETAEWPVRFIHVQPMKTKREIIS